MSSGHPPPPGFPPAQSAGLTWARRISTISPTAVLPPSAWSNPTGFGEPAVTGPHGTSRVGQHGYYDVVWMDLTRSQSGTFGIGANHVTGDEQLVGGHHMPAIGSGGYTGRCIPDGHVEWRNYRRCGADVVDD